MNELLVALFRILVFPGLLFLFVYATVAEYLDRKWYASMQRRIGPPFFQPIADFFKLMAKEDITPEAADPTIFNVLPLIGFASVALSFLMIPIVSYNLLPGFYFPYDLLVVLYLLTVPSVCFFLAGWSSANIFGTIGSTRVLTALFAYEVPLFAAFLAPAMLADSWQISEISRFYAMNPSLLFVNLLAFIVALIAVQGKLERVPFDIPEAETEIVGGPLTEVSGKKLAIYRLMLDMELVVCASLIGALFLGGFVSKHGVGISLISYFIKTLIVIYLLTVIRTIFARLRIEQMVSFCWRYLTPLAFVQMFIIIFVKGWWI